MDAAHADNRQHQQLVAFHRDSHLWLRHKGKSKYKLKQQDILSTKMKQMLKHDLSTPPPPRTRPCASKSSPSSSQMSKGAADAAQSEWVFRLKLEVATNDLRTLRFLGANTKRADFDAFAAALRSATFPRRYQGVFKHLWFEQIQDRCTKPRAMS